MATMPKEYWQTYKRQSPHISGAHVSFRRRVSSDWVFFGEAATSMELTSTDLAREVIDAVVAKNNAKIAKLCLQIAKGGIKRSDKKTQRWIRHDALEDEGVFARVREVFLGLSEFTDPGSKT